MDAINQIGMYSTTPHRRLVLTLLYVPVVAFGFGMETIVTPLAAASQPSSSSSSTTTTTKTALILLNTPIDGSPLFYHLWDTADVRICADGGANRLYRLKNSTTSTAATRSTTLLIPDIIVGDLDSLHDTTRAYYANEQQQHGVEILHDPDQDTNDLDKAIRVAQQRLSSSFGVTTTTTTIVIYGSMGGRLDQSMACLHALLKYSNNDDNSTTRRYFWYSDTSMACVIPPSSSTAAAPHRLVLRLPPSPSSSSSEDHETVVVTEGPTCGLLPLGEPVESVTTTGLQWNLHEQPTRFGDGLVSTSNRILSKNSEGLWLTIRTSHPLVFTAEIQCGMKTEWTEE